MNSQLKGAIAFAELLSCGFATIGVRATLVAIAAQLIDDTVLRAERPPALDRGGLIDCTAAEAERIGTIAFKGSTMR
jgi:hypothetical protein